MDRQLLARATEGTDAPTPGYMYLDIAKNAAASPQACQELAQYLTRRLSSKQNHNIKYKCLKIISKTCESPATRSHFKRTLAQDPSAVAAIKDALYNFRGPPDPVRGDEIYARVREAAKEALDAVYSDTPTSAETSSVPTSSYGPSPHAMGMGGMGGGGGGGAGPRRMEGIGNPMYADPRTHPSHPPNMTLKDAVREAGETIVGMIKDPLARNVSSTTTSDPHSLPRPGSMPGYGSGGPGSYGRPPPGRSDVVNATNGQWTMASNRGPGAVVPPPNFDRDAAYFKARDNSSAFQWAQRDGASQNSHPPTSSTAGGVGGSWASTSVASQARQPPHAHASTPSIAISGASSGVTGSSGGAVSDGSYEKTLVMELCPPGGLKAEPPPDRLAAFAKLIPSLNPDLVCPVLLDCVEDGQPWIIRAKALCVMETCIGAGRKPDDTNPYLDFFYTCREEILPLATHTRPAIRVPARRLLHALGVDAPSSSENSPAPTPAGKEPQEVPNLLDLDDPVPQQAAVPAPVTAPPPPPSDSAAASSGPSSSLFGGMNIKGTNAAAAPAQKTETPATAFAPPSAAPSSGNLLGDMSELLQGTSTNANDLSSQPKSEVFGEQKPSDNTGASASAGDANAVSSMFDNMSLKKEATDNVEAAAAQAHPGSGDTGTNEPNDASAAMPANGSAFGFINDAAKNEAELNSSKAPINKESFDPLLNVTPGTAKKVMQSMQFSPQQMQAMAYQQMMMQQQMQHMQMALIQQQQQKQQQHRMSGSSNMGMGMPSLPQMGSARHVMNNPASSNTSFSFLDPSQAAKREKQDKTFDFVKDAMKSEKKK